MCQNEGVIEPEELQRLEIEAANREPYDAVKYLQQQTKLSYQVCIAWVRVIHAGAILDDLTLH